MIVVKLKLVNGYTEVFTTERYSLSSVKEMHPDILDVKIYSNRKRLAHKRRKFQWFYKKYLYKPLPQEQAEDSVKNNIKKPATKKTATKKK